MQIYATYNFFFANISLTISSKPIAFKFGLNIDIGDGMSEKSLVLKFELQFKIYATYSLLVAIVLLLTQITVYAWVLPFSPRERFIHVGEARYGVACTCST